MRTTRLLPLLLILACPPAEDADGDDSDTDTDPGIGIPSTAAGETWAGAAVVDLTPPIPETFTDVDGNALFDGDFEDPSGSEPYDDANGDGWFDAVFIGGFDPLRPANGTRDPITARAVVIEDGGSYVAMVVLDFVGLANPRIDAARERLVALGLDPEALIVSTTHNHQGPDTMGLWGNPYGCLLPTDGPCVPGFDEAYQERVVDGIVQAVLDAIADMEPVELKVGARPMREVSPWFSGEVFGGVNPTRKMHGMVNDIRDPVIVSDQLLAMQGVGEDGVVFTLTNWSGHPEVRGGGNDQLSSDWVGVTREALEAQYGGVALHFPECLGGMQSALGGDLPLVDEEGEVVIDTCTQALLDASDPTCDGASVGDPRVYPDRDGLQVPVWAERNSWDFVRSHGWHIARAAIDLLDAADTTSADPIKAASVSSWVPVRNVAYNVLGPKGVFDLPLTEGTFDTTLCPEAASVDLGCIPFRVHRLQIGPVGFATAPGELLPELAWGFPTDDPRWDDEAVDPTTRGPGSAYFPQHPSTCDDVPFSDCNTRMTDGDCDCLRLHAWPYTIAEDASLQPVLAALDTPYRAAISNTSTYLSYIVPQPDTHRGVSLLTDDGDHYEDTVTPAWDFGELYLKAWAELQEDWD